MPMLQIPGDSQPTGLLWAFLFRTTTLSEWAAMWLGLFLRILVSPSQSWVCERSHDVSVFVCLELENKPKLSCPIGKISRGGLWKMLIGLHLFQIMRTFPLHYEGWGPRIQVRYYHNVPIILWETHIILERSFIHYHHLRHCAMGIN